MMGILTELKNHLLHRIPFRVVVAILRYHVVRQYHRYLQVAYISGTPRSRGEKMGYLSAGLMTWM